MYLIINMKWKWINIVQSRRYNMNNTGFRNEDLLKEHNELLSEYDGIINISKESLVNFRKTNDVDDLMYTLMALIKYDDKKQNFDEKLRTISELENYEVIWN